CDVPPSGSVVAPPGVLAVGSAGDDDHHRGDFRVPAADFQPDVFEHLQDPAGGLGAVAVRGPVLVACPVAGTGVPGLSVAIARGLVAGEDAVEPVVPAAPVRVDQGVVGFGDLPELLSGVAAVVHIRVALLGQLAVGRLD